MKKLIIILTLILCFAIPAFAVKILPYNMPLHDIMSWDQNSATLKIANPEGESVSVAWASTVDLWNYDGATWKFDLPSGDVFEFGKQVTLGTSGSPFSFTYAEKVLSVYTTCASTNGSTTAVPVYINSIYTAAGQVGRAIEANLETNVAMGGWMNAIKGYTEFTGTSGRTTGLASAVCAEMLMPNATLASGVYCPLEIEYVAGGTSTNTVGGLTGVHAGFIYMNSSGDADGDFNDNGYLMCIDGLTAGTTHLLYNNTLKMAIGTTKWYIPLSSAQGSFTTAYPIVTTSTITSTCVNAGLDINASTLNATTGRIAKLFGSIAAGNLGDGYGAVEIDVTSTGTVSGTIAASSTWLTIASGTPGANTFCVQNNGIYVASGLTSTSAKMIMGMRMQYVAADGADPGSLYCFSTNISANQITAIFDVNAAVDFRWVATALSGSSGYIPLFRDASAGVTYYVNVYTN